MEYITKKCLLYKHFCQLNIYYLQYTSSFIFNESGFHCADSKFISVQMYIYWLLKRSSPADQRTVRTELSRNTYRCRIRHRCKVVLMSCFGESNSSSE